MSHMKMMTYFYMYSRAHWMMKMTTYFYMCSRAHWMTLRFLRVCVHDVYTVCADIADRQVDCCRNTSASLNNELVSGI